MLRKPKRQGLIISMKQLSLFTRVAVFFRSKTQQKKLKKLQKIRAEYYYFNFLIY